MSVSSNCWIWQRATATDQRENATLLPYHVISSRHVTVLRSTKRQQKHKHEHKPPIGN